MTFFRRSRFFAALVAMFSVLFTQLAVAGYVCPQLDPVVETVTVMVVTDQEAMLPCHEIDDAKPHLCSAHAQEGNHSLDKPDLPSVQQFVAGTLSGTVTPVEPNKTFSSVVVDLAFLLTRATAPPVAIQHCCFRI